jgi:MFS transporter, DHA1 family, multidrug resistance protein
MSPFVRICGIGFFFWIAYDFARFPVIPLLATELGVPPDQVGFIVAAGTITGIFGKSITGSLSDIFGRRSMMIVGCLVGVLMPFSYLLFVKGAASLFVIRMIHGLGTAIMGPVTRAAASDVIDSSRRGVKLGTFTSATKMGTAVGRWGGGALLFWGGYQYPFLASAGAALIALFLVLSWSRHTRVTHGTTKIIPEMMQGFREVASSRLILLTSVVEALQFFAQGAMEAFLPLYGKLVIGLNNWEIGLLYGLQMGATIVAKPLMGHVSDRMGRHPQIIVGFGIGAAVFWLFPRTDSLMMLSVLSIIYGIGFAVNTAATIAYVTDLCERHRYGSAHGVFGTIFDVGHASGPIVGGLLVVGLGYEAMFLVMSFVLLFALILFANLSRRWAAQ